MVTEQTTIPVFVDGAKIGDATGVRVEHDEPVRHSGIRYAGPAVVTEHEPPRHYLDVDIPSVSYAPITSTSTVTVAVPESAHSGDAWRIVEISELQSVSINEGGFECMGWQCRKRSGVESLGPDVADYRTHEADVADDEGNTIRLDTDADHDRTDAEFGATVHDV